jgi:2-(1,2-epoxy-1,2-dihydrophenyl)acetyl-CoA isomerase
MSDFETILFEVADGVGRVTLNRPDQLNATTRKMAQELTAVVARAAEDDEIRVVLITGAGRAFSAGADLKDEWPTTLDGAPDTSANLTHWWNPLILSLRRLPKPVIAAVNGPAAGFSCGMALACDFIVAAESAYFLLAFAKIGLVPDGGTSVTVPARIGLTRATKMAMLADKLPAPEALEWGLITEVFPDDEFAAGAAALAQRLATGPTNTYAAIKALFNRQLLPALEGQLGAEASAQFQRGIHPEHAEGKAAFREKRAADFRSL